MCQNASFPCYPCRPTQCGCLTRPHGPATAARGTPHGLGLGIRGPTLNLMPIKPIGVAGPTDPKHSWSQCQRGSIVAPA